MLNNNKFLLLLKKQNKVKKTVRFLYIIFFGYLFI